MWELVVVVGLSIAVFLTALFLSASPALIEQSCLGENILL